MPVHKSGRLLLSVSYEKHSDLRRTALFCFLELIADICFRACFYDKDAFQ